VSVGRNGTEADWKSETPSISADGRWVAFASSATNLVGGDTNGWQDVFAWDRITGVTSLVSVGTGGAPADSYSFAPSLSADGRWISFMSMATNLTTGDTHAWNQSDVFVTDRTTGDTTLVSAGLDGPHLGFGVGPPSISADGRWIVYTSQASNLVPVDTNPYQDVFVWDRVTRQASVVSVRADGSSANSHSTDPSISADGRWIAYQSYATNLADGSTNGACDVFVTDRNTGITSLVSVGMGVVPANGGSYEASISADGQHIAYASAASNLVASDTNGRWDVFVADRVTG
jgi:Tol biopolymer transport system component